MQAFLLAAKHNIAFNVNIQLLARLAFIPIIKKFAFFKSSL